MVGGRHFACALVLLAALVQPVHGGQEGEAAVAPKLPKPVRVDPAAMPLLPPAVIDNTLAIGGEDINAKKVRSRMTIAVDVNGTGPFRFVVDSGADSSVIGRRVAERLQLPQGTPITLNGITASSVVPRVLVDELGLGPTSAVDLELPVLAELGL
mgnify:CR=1 FL=1